jgi:hypothetical protein
VMSFRVELVDGFPEEVIVLLSGVAEHAGR